MATAGRILIMPKGTWNAETTYENLDMVAHSGRAWLAKKVSVGIEPSDANAEFWHDFLGMDVFTEANPPTAAQVGAVSLYADPVLSKSTDWDNLESGTYRFSTWGGSGGVGYPPIDDVGICILFDTEVGRYMYCLGMNRIVSRYYESKTWSDWIEGYLPLTGGTLSDSLTIDGGTTTTKLIMKRTMNDTPYSFHYGIASVSSDVGGVIELYKNNSSAIVSRIALTETDLAIRLNSVSKYHKLFGEHNKPSGSYNGNGSATSRTVNVGGIGNALLITTNYGDMTIATKSGALIMKAGTVSGLSSTSAKFVDGVLTLATTETALNENSRNYTYQVL